MAFGLPSTGGNAPNVNRVLAPGQGLFEIPTGIQRLAEYTLYSTVKIAAAANVAGQEFRFFSSGLSMQGQGFTFMSYSETNVQVGAMIPGGESYQVSSLACEVFGASGVAPLIGDVRLLQRLGYFVWEFAGITKIPIAQLSMIGAGGGIFGFTADTGTPVTQANNGNGGLWCYQNVVVSLPSTQQFAILLMCGYGGSAAGTSITVTNETQVRFSMFNNVRIAVPIG